VFAIGCAVTLFIVFAILAMTKLDPRSAYRAIRRVNMKTRTAEDPTTAASKDLDRHAKLLEIGKKETVGVLFLGDSITEQWSTTGHSSWSRLARYKPANFGVGADCTEHLLWRIENGELDSISPKVVTVLIGSNNVSFFPNEQPEWTVAGIEKIASTIRGRLPASKILLFAIFPRDEPNSRIRRSIGVVNEGIRHLDHGTNICFLDIGADFLDQNGKIPVDIMPDKVHLTAKGYEIWYHELESVLSEIFK
jgi:beta-glucosidase